MRDDRIRCVYCGQDYLTPYRSARIGREFLLCPECDSVWLPGEDTAEQPKQHLDQLFDETTFLPGQVAWDFIEPVE